MGAEQLIAFEAALAEVSRLYLVAKEFRPLALRAETELLPASADLGARLRRLVRQGRLDAPAVDAVARDIAALRHQWRQALADLRESELYQSCLTAYEAEDQAALAQRIPQLSADCAHVAAPPPLYYPVSPSSGRRKPGHSPFLTPSACAARVAGLQEHGIPAEPGGSEWWETELVPISLSGDVAAFDIPVALRCEPGTLGVSVFRMGRGETFHVYAPRLRVPFTVVVQEEVDDEWWQAFAGTYASWRLALLEELRARRLSAT